MDCKGGEEMGLGAVGGYWVTGLELRVNSPRLRMECGESECKGGTVMGQDEAGQKQRNRS